MPNRLVFNEDSKLQPGGQLYSSRSKENACKQPIATRDYYNYFFYPRTISKWNKLPRELHCPVHPLHLKLFAKQTTLKTKETFNIMSFSFYSK